ncbi:MAG: hypothetical protein BWY46_02019 [Firmicutes bacterium ADurb.Bin300]|jgi:N utilization substance protein B|nr:MAG: hypothetical protein BWY46_02019 [Firmicutes bacterium ADurb.Bin300]
MNRHRAREQAFNIIFEKLFNEDVQTEKLFELGVAEGLFEEDEFSISLAGLTESKSGEIDKLIEENSIGWRLSRLPKVSLAVLRLAVCEMLYIEDVPVSVSINEAVELAKKYGTGEDASFINGVLGTIAKSIEV